MTRKLFAYFFSSETLLHFHICELNYRLSTQNCASVLLSSYEKCRYNFEAETEQLGKLQENVIFLFLADKTFE